MIKFGYWPQAILYCVRNPLEHQSYYSEFRDYPIDQHSGVLGPIVNERCEDCGAMMYVAAVLIRSEGGDAT